MTSLRDLLENDWFVGIATGLLVAILVAVPTTVASSPTLRRLFVRRAFNLGGVWDVFDTAEPSDRPVGTWKVRQWGNQIWVRAVRVSNRNGSPMHRRFRMTGTWRADQLCCLFEDVDGPHRNGAVVLRWMGSGHGTVLSGKTVFWDRTPDPGEHQDQGPSGVVALPYCIRKRTRPATAA